MSISISGHNKSIHWAFHWASLCRPGIILAILTQRPNNIFLVYFAKVPYILIFLKQDRQTDKVKYRGSTLPKPHLQSTNMAGEIWICFLPIDHKYCYNKLELKKSLKVWSFYIILQITVWYLRGSYLYLNMWTIWTLDLFSKNKGFQQKGVFVKVFSKVV